jgi:hypothetical protein
VRPPGSEFSVIYFEFKFLVHRFSPSLFLTALFQPAEAEKRCQASSFVQQSHKVMHRLRFKNGNYANIKGFSAVSVILYDQYKGVTQKLTDFWIFG